MQGRVEEPVAHIGAQHRSAAHLREHMAAPIGADAAAEAFKDCPRGRAIDRRDLGGAAVHRAARGRLQTRRTGAEGAMRDLYRTPAHGFHPSHAPERY